jgi:hypothetical protein
MLDSRKFVGQATNKGGDDDDKEAGIDQFIVFGKPVGEIDIKVIFSRIGIFSGHDGKWTHFFKN